MRIIYLFLLMGMLSGCAAAPMVLSSIGGALSIAKDVFELDTSIHQFENANRPQLPAE